MSFTLSTTIFCPTARSHTEATMHVSCLNLSTDTLTESYDRQCDNRLYNNSTSAVCFNLITMLNLLLCSE